MNMNKKYNNGFTMVEMLAVIAIVSVLVAIVVPNGIFARTSGEEAVARAQAASLETAMGVYHVRDGAVASSTWADAIGSDPSLANMYGVLQAHGAMPTSSSFNQISQAFEGYAILMPATISGQITVTRSADNAVIYP